MLRRHSRAPHLVVLISYPPSSRVLVGARSHASAHTAESSVYSRWASVSLRRPALRSLPHLSASCNRPRRSFGVADRQMDGSSLHRCTHHARRAPPRIYAHTPRLTGGLVEDADIAIRCRRTIGCSCLGGTITVPASCKTSWMACVRAPARPRPAGVGGPQQPARVRSVVVVGLGCARSTQAHISVP
jgi:hypothetical protein